ncbi:SCO1860 family LAETG-anchored protein [Streptomyces boluensis]|uniref:LPXTG cell wall anchor domain-containing protein n=1 Tax=Streptomyces boluensis TaxID=1775135 RepID=A0A964URU5_9ACTN|nr:SCO1860 family LAETG-anchored protein [Streptomyces boluensis]NBE54199.1 LPXTG cell wall anchor domain-containing protein [Streptomyces boluensis]
MNSNTFRTPAPHLRRIAATVAATALAAGPAALVGAVPAHATGGDGKASAVVLRAGLDVSLLNKAVQVPVRTSLNEVSAPATARKTALTVDVEGVDQGRPFSMVHANVATAKATADRHGAQARTHLARARVQLPGLPALPLIELENVTSKAVCVAGERPVADADVVGSVTVLGKKVTLTAGGPTRIEVPGVGEVRLDLAKTHTTSRTAAASALELKVSVNPLKLNVAEVEGLVTLAGATCEAPTAPPRKPEPKDEPKGEVRPQAAAEPEALAETGGDSRTPYLAYGGVALLALGGGAVYLARTRKRV